MLSGRRKLLLADDSPTIQKVISLTFADEGMEVVAVGDGVQALRALEDETPPAVVLADVVMPGPDGYELCERVKRDGRLRHVPVVLLVGTFEPFNEAEARRVGADTVLTKPFQSIRDLVSKVGSLLGGGEPKEEQAGHAPPDEPAAETPAARADATPQPAAAAPEGEASAGTDDAVGEEAASPFADFGADDELIEAKPADAFGAPAPSAWPHTERRRAFAEAGEPDLPAAPHSEENGGASPAAYGAAAPVEVEEAAPVGAGLSEQTEERAMHEETSPQPSFDSGATGAAADDALLDLVQVNAPAPAPARTAEADDFILDLDFGDETPPAPAWADAPSAFAEAAHGESRGHSAEAPPAEVLESFWEPAASTSESVPSSSEEAAPLFGATPSLVESESPDTSEGGDEPWRDVVVQDGPQGFAFGGEEPQAMRAAPRGFVEPEVVPADEPVPAVVESEFTDGSVEGDLPRPPAAGAAGSHEAASPRMASAHGASQQEPSTAGYAVGEARVGLAEPVRADQLSPETIDAIARRVVELMSDKVVREIAWEVVPELAELLVKQRLDEGRRS